MTTRITFAIITIVLLLAVVFYFTKEQNDNFLGNNLPANVLPDEITEPILNDIQSGTFNAAYLFDNHPIKLNAGQFIGPVIPNEAARSIVNIFGEPIYADLDNDNDQDAALILVQESGGSGTFYYVAAVINNDSEYIGTNVILLGDRIAPQTLENRNGIIIANYADRNADEPMTTQPSVGKSKYLKLENGELKEANTKDDLISVDFPVAGSVISSPLTFSGRARGTWFFEASFPVVLVDWDGLIIAQGIATADGEWMTEDYVPFTGTLEFTVPDYGDRGAIIFRKDNPSGLPEHDNALEMPIFFK